ncbi:MAG: serine/threonine-protein phosphatase [Firmicutes bacterium]|nr:serine/threonine-protein phosphatase [Bacillota bacterium]
MIGTRIEVAWAKMPKGALGESGDSIELVERPLGGVSLVLADGQGSGPAARRISRMVAMKAIGLVADGSRDGAVARAVQDMLYTAREGRVTSTLTILSIDLSTRTAVIARNSSCPVVVRQEAAVFRLEGHAEAIGTYRRTRPAMTELPLTSGTVLATFSDGIIHAGRRVGKTLPWETLDEELRELDAVHLGIWVQSVLDRAVTLDGGRPQDDMSVMALAAVEDDRPPLRWLRASIPT